MTPSTILLKKDSSSRRRWPEGPEEWRESLEVGRRRWESKSSLSMCGVEGRVELREGIVGSGHCHCEREGYFVVVEELFSFSVSQPLRSIYA